jgi:signal transduction histidine kinase
MRHHSPRTVHTAYARFGRDAEPSEPVDSAAVFAAVRSTDLAADIKDAAADVTAGPLPRVRVSAPALSQLFQNLIGNALKYRAPGRKAVVRVDACIDAGRWLFAVTDKGIGIHPDHFRKVFLLGIDSRVHDTKIWPPGQKPEGTGMGLSTCERIVESRGGRIWVESPGLDQGATVYFTLPPA